jgi:hypothetical protein
MAGKLVVPPDYSASLLAVIDPVTQTMTQQYACKSAEQGAWIPAARKFLLPSEDSSQQISEYALYDDAFANTLNDTSLVVTDPQEFSPVTHNRVDTFYVLRSSYSWGSFPPTVKTIDINGVVGGTTWTLPNPNDQFYESVALSVDGSILYYGDRPSVNVNVAAIHRYNLNTSTALSDLFVGGTPNSVGQDLIVLADDSVLFPYRTGLVNSGPWFVKRYAANGTLLNTYTVGTSVRGNVVCPRICVEDDELSLWVMSFPNLDANSNPYPSRFTKFDIATAAQLDQFDIPNFLAGPFFGYRQDNTGSPSQSCPLFWMEDAEEPVAPPPYTRDEALAAGTLENAAIRWLRRAPAVRKVH